MFIVLTADVDDLRLRATAGFVTAVMDDFGVELLAAGKAVEIDREEFHARLMDRPQDFQSKEGIATNDTDDG